MLILVMLETVLPLILAATLMNHHHLEPHDPGAFHALVAESAEVEQLADGFSFIEGPVWVGDRLIFSDIPNKTLHSFTPGDDAAGTWRQQQGNGNTIGPDGRIYMAGHDSRVVKVAELPDGPSEVLVGSFEHDGQTYKFNSPNDIVVRSDGLVFFTDPYWGLPGDKRDELMEYGDGGQWVFMFDPKTEKITVLATDFDRPNGLAFSPDESQLYVGDDAKRHVRRFDVADDGTLNGGDVFTTIAPGVPDGMRVDTQGNLFCTAGDGVQVFAPDGRLLGKVLVPETPANCELANGRLYMTAKTGLYAIDVKATGATADRAE